MAQTEDSKGKLIKRECNDGETVAEEKTNSWY